MGQHQYCPSCGAPFAFKNPPQFGHALKPRTVLAKQTSPIFVGKCLGGGGFGLTYLGLNNLQQRIVLKELFPRDYVERATDLCTVLPLQNFSDTYTFGLSGFLDEARTIARFHEHPNVVKILYFFEENQTAYFTMLYRQGNTLEEYVKQQISGGGITESELLTIMLQALQGLTAVHNDSILHRDLKPSNIYVPTQGEAFLIDFGTARQVSRNHALATGLTPYRTPGYAPKEQYDYLGKQGAYTDIYACAATLYVCMHSKVTARGTLEPLPEAFKLCDGAYSLAPLEQVARQPVSERFVTAVTAGLQCHPEDRPQTVAEFVKLLTTTATTAVEFHDVTSYYELSILAGEYQNETIPLTTELMIGRDATVCHLVLQDSRISAQHCRLWRQDNTLFLQNFRPTNGTYVNDQLQPVEAIVPLRPLDVINLANCQVFQIQVVSTDSSPAKASSPTSFWKSCLHRLTLLNLGSDAMWVK
jgi:serine/threonine protein kinase